MAKFVALYKQPADKTEFDKNYFDHHLPLAKKIPGLIGIDILRVAGTPMGNSDLYLIAELKFESLESMKAGMASEEGRAAGKNLMGFAKDLVTMYFTEEEKMPATCNR